MGNLKKSVDNELNSCYIKDAQGNEQEKEAETITESKAHAEWTKANTQLVAIRLNNRLDKDIIKKLAEAGNKQGYIKSLIRADIAKTKSSDK